MAAAGGCQEASGLLQALVDGALTAGERAVVESHLAACHSCAAEGARLRDNSHYLQEALSSFRMPAEFATDFLFRLPRKGARRAAAAAAPAAPRTVVMGDTRARGPGPLRWVVAAVFLAAAGLLAWLFLGPEEEPQRRDRTRTLEVKPRPEKGAGDADPRRKPGPVGPSTGPAPPKAGPAPAGEPIRTAADLAATLRGVRGDNLGPVVHRGWDLLAGSPEEAGAARELAAREKDPRVRAGLVLSLGCDAGDENRSALRGFLSDEDAGVRCAAVQGLARSLSIANPPTASIPPAPPVNLAVPVGPLPDDPGRSDLAARLTVDPDPGVRRTLLLALAPSASSETGIRDRILDGVKGVYGDDLREVSLKALGGLQDAALVPVYAEALTQQGTPRALHAGLIEGMLAADRGAASEALAGLLGQAEGTDLRRELVGACGRAGGGPAERALLVVLSSDAEAAVRLASLQALQRFPSREVLDAVLKAAENDADHGVRQESERIGRALKATVEKMEGPQENPAGDDPPAPPPPAGDR